MEDNSTFTKRMVLSTFQELLISLLRYVFFLLENDLADNDIQISGIGNLNTDGTLKSNLIPTSLGGHSIMKASILS